VPEVIKVEKEEKAQKAMSAAQDKKKLAIEQKKLDLQYRAEIYHKRKKEV